MAQQRQNQTMVNAVIHNRDASVTPPQLDLSQRMLNLQLEPFAGGVEGANIVSWLQSTETRLCICQVPEPMWVATVSGCLIGPAAVWFTNWASQELDVTWAVFRDAAKSCYSETFSPVVVGTLLLAIKQTGFFMSTLPPGNKLLLLPPKP
ncbi:hypothetical protein DSO57_1012675 [Entomophthora muscae]|uniref:Uncharacterized protein n=1 Tax=Entomophthora muscae TaxID=34485 RepID=A0ACC2RX86_9FUNG|nr:hypothetical protein DSO57_1012675 [Entomophthora muscae]